MSSRRMSLLLRAALRRDSEQFIYNWMLEDDLELDHRQPLAKAHSSFTI